MERMRGLVHIDKMVEYLDYLREHILNVKKAWEEVQSKCKDMRVVWDDYYFHWLDSEVRFHDVSKFSEHELVQYRKSFYKLKSEEKYDMSQAWEHHKSSNTHHWENWIAKEMSHPNEWEIHCTHMVIDWMAMGYKFGDTAKEYYETNKDRIDLPDYAVKYIYDIFKRVYQ